MKHRKGFYWNLLNLTILTVLLFSCRQLKEMAAFSKCEFRLNTIENINLAGVNVQNIKSVSDLNLTDAARLTAAATQNNFPLSFVLNMDVKNPNTTTASLNRLDWHLIIDDIEMLQGTTQNKIQVLPNTVGQYPMSFNINLKEVLNNKSGSGLVNFALNLANAGNKPTRITLRAKPYVYVGNIQIPYPGYINIKNDFVSN